MRPTPLRPDAQAFLDWLDRHPGPKFHEIDPVEARRRDFRMHRRWAGPLGDVARIEDLYGPVAIRRYDDAPDAGHRPALVYYHGGGYVVGSLETHAPLCAELARLTGLPVFAVDYRLAPEHPWPAGPEDCEAAARWIADLPDVTGLVLAGDSAGGMMTIVSGLALRNQPAAVPLRALWPIYPATSPSGRFPSLDRYGEGHFLTRPDLGWFMRHYACDPRHWRANPLAADLAGLPPTIILTAQCDPLADQGRLFAERCEAAGVKTLFREIPGMIHGFASLRAAMPSAGDDMRWCLAELETILNS